MSNDLTLVLGATGKTGRRILPRLGLRGVPVRAASRSSHVRFDWSDPAGWDAALRGVGTVYLVAPYEVGPVPEFVERAEAANVRHVVVQSARGADTWGESRFGQDMLAAERAVRESTLAWTVLRPCNFDQNFDEAEFRAAVVAGELALPGGDVPEPFIDVEDLADVAAEVLAEPDRHAGQVYELTGPRALDFGEATDVISRVSGSAVAFKQVSVTEFLAMADEHGLSEAEATNVADMFVMLARGLAATPTDEVAALLGRPPQTFEDYVVRTAATGVWSRR